MVSKRTGTSRWMFALIALVLSLALVACGGNAQPTVEVAPGDTGADTTVTEEAAPATEATEEAAPTEETAAPAQATEEPAATEAASGGGDVFTFKGLNEEDLNSYTANLVMDFEGQDDNGDPVSGSITMAITAQRDPLAMMYEYESADLGDLASGAGEIDPSMMGSMKFYVTADQAAMDMGGMCFSFPADEGTSAVDEFGGMMINPDDFTRPGEAMPELTLVGKETVNGQQANHYHGEGTSLSEVNDATLDIWVTTDGGYVTRMEVSGVTSDSSFEYGAGTVHMVYDVTGVNQPVSITVPDNCQEFTMPDIPAMPTDEG